MPVIVKNKYKWSPKELELLDELFSSTTNRELSKLFEVGVRTVIRKARELGLEKHEKFRILIDFSKYGTIGANHPKAISTRFKKGEHISPETEFKKGNIPWIKGKTVFEKLNYQLNKKHKSIISIITK